MKVLILVVMEDSLGLVPDFGYYCELEKVLILVVMEDSLGLKWKSQYLADRLAS